MKNTCINLRHPGNILLLTVIWIFIFAIKGECDISKRTIQPGIKSSGVGSSDIGTQPFDEPGDGYFEEDGTTGGFSYEITPDGSAAKITGTVTRGSNFEPHNNRAKLELMHAFHCEAKALQAKQDGKQDIYDAMHKHAQEAARIALTEFQKHMDIVNNSESLKRVLANEVPDEKVVWPFHTYANLAFCDALLGQPEQSLSDIDKFIIEGIGNDYDVLGPSGNKSYYACYKLAIVLLAEGDFSEAKELLTRTMIENNFLSLPTEHPHEWSPDGVLAWKLVAAIDKKQGNLAQSLQAEQAAQKILAQLGPDKQQSRVLSIRQRMMRIGINPDQNEDNEKDTVAKKSDSHANLIFGYVPLGALDASPYFYTDADNINPLNTATDIKRKKFEYLIHSAYIDFGRAMYCENCAIRAKNSGNKKYYTDLHAKAIEYTNLCLTKLEKHLASMNMSSAVPTKEEAKQFGTLLNEDAEPFWTYANIAAGKALLGLSQQAKDNANQIVATFGDYCHAPAACLNIACILFAENKLSEAKDLCEQCLALHNDCFSPDQRLFTLEMVSAIARRQDKHEQYRNANAEAEKLFSQLHDSETIFPTGNLQKIQDSLIKMGIDPDPPLIM